MSFDTAHLEQLVVPELMMSSDLPFGDRALGSLVAYIFRSDAFGSHAASAALDSAIDWTALVIFGCVVAGLGREVLRVLRAKE